MSWPLYGILGLVVALLVSVPFLSRRMREIDLHQAGLDDPARVDDDGFARHMTGLLRALGYRVTPAEPNDPYDLILTDGLGQQRAALIRHWRKQVDENIVRDFAQAARRLGPGAPLIVTIKRFTFRATETAKETGMLLWALPDLAKAISQVKTMLKPLPEMSRRQVVAASGKIVKEPEMSPALKLLQQQVAAEPPVATVPTPAARRRPARMRRGDRALPVGEIPFCPRCGRKMELRPTPQGEFWACPQFPRCLGTRRKD